MPAPAPPISRLPRPWSHQDGPGASPASDYREREPYREERPADREPIRFRERLSRVRDDRAIPRLRRSRPRRRTENANAKPPRPRAIVPERSTTGR